MKYYYLLFAFAFTAGIGAAQAPVASTGAELSVPFGSAVGQVAVIEEYLVFLNKDRPESSFALEQSNVVNASVQNEMVTIQTKERVGDLNQFTFRLDDPMQVGTVLAWAKVSPSLPTGSSQPQNEPATTSRGQIIGEYQARHKHRFGGCEGKLIITETQVIYESVTNIDDSRQWAMGDLKEIKRSSPYEFSLTPFVGSNYDFQLQGGDGMTSAQYKQLTDRVTGARLDH